MTRKLCELCSSSCYVEDEIRRLQGQVPNVRSIKTDQELATVSRLLIEEKDLHQIGRDRHCPHHNGYTLRIPPYNRRP